MNLNSREIALLGIIFLVASAMVNAIAAGKWRTLLLGATLMGALGVVGALAGKWLDYLRESKTLTPITKLAYLPAYALFSVVTLGYLGVVLGMIFMLSKATSPS